MVDSRVGRRSCLGHPQAAGDCVRKTGLLAIAIDFAWAVTARAHPRIDDARRALEEARFEGALGILDRSDIG